MIALLPTLFFLSEPLIFNTAAHVHQKRRLIEANRIVQNLVPDIRPPKADLLSQISEWVAEMLVCLALAWAIIRISGLWVQNWLLDSLSIVVLALVLHYIGKYLPWVLSTIWVYGGPFKLADYEGALHRVPVTRFWHSHWFREHHHGVILFAAGRYEEMETLYRSLLPRVSDSVFMTSVSLLYTGYALMGQNRYREALPFFEAAIEIYPEYGSPYWGLANWYIRQRFEAERALKLCELELRPKPNTNWFGQKDTWAQNQANYAIALAMTNHDNRAIEMLATAFQVVDPHSRPRNASLHSAAGVVYQVQGNNAAAKEHFHKAIELDPNGHAGKTAARELKTLEEA